MNLRLSKTFVILFGIFIQHQVLGIRPSQFCNLVDKECVGNYNSRYNYQIICDYVKCPTALPYRCGSYKCSVGKKECDEYMKMNRYSNSVIFKTSIMSQKAIDTINSFDQDFVKFKKKIKNCPHQAYDWKVNDVCAADANCYEKEEIHGKYNFIMKMFSNNKYILKRVNCPCSTGYSFKCGKMYCAINKRACDRMPSPAANVSVSACINNDEQNGKSGFFQELFSHVM